MKLKNIKKTLVIFIIFVFVVSLVPVKTFDTNATLIDTNVTEGNTFEDSSEDDLFADTSDDSSDDINDDLNENAMVHFTMRVRWGNVIEEPINTDKETFNGEISVFNNAKVSLEKTLLFENHNETDDSIISKKNPVSWNSAIYNHWDGVVVAVSSPSKENVTITAGENLSLTKTAKELYDSKDQIIVDEKNGKEIVIKVYPAAKHPSIFLKVFWGKIDKTSYSEKRCFEGIGATEKCWLPLLNADGSLSINESGKLKLIKPLRFEWPDKILLKSEIQIDWRSRLYGGADGILVQLKLNANKLDSSDELTINFNNHENNFPRSYNILDLYHDKYTEDIVADGYGVVLQVWRRPNKSLIRVDGKQKVYLIEDGVKRHIPSEEVLYSQGLTFDNVNIVDQDEADTLADGDPINFSDGTIVREEETQEVYVIENGEKKHIIDPESFEKLGYNWNNIVKVKKGILGLFRKGVNLKADSVHPEGALIRIAGYSKVYVIEGGRRVPISDIQLFNARRYDWSKVLIVNENQANKFETGTSLKYPDGSLLKDMDGKVFIIDQGKKRWIRSGDDFVKAGYNESDILEVENNMLEDFSDGIDILVDDIQ